MVDEHIGKRGGGVCDVRDSEETSQQTSNQLIGAARGRLVQLGSVALLVRGPVAAGIDRCLIRLIVDDQRGNRLHMLSWGSFVEPLVHGGKHGYPLLCHDEDRV